MDTAAKAGEPRPRVVRAALLAWYDRHRRRLPWRALPGASADPYRVWLSEIMLQQTTVPHATPYFQAFTARWPTVIDLAAARDDDVMAAWSGLGYYARARNLLACARTVAAGGGDFPGDEAELRRLPGVGGYTAAAIAAIAFDQAANVVDGNVERVMARLFAVETPLPAAKPELTALAARFVSDERPGDWAQALMDLGSAICRPRQPDCDACPLAGSCLARASGAPSAYPRRTARTPRPVRHGVAYVLLWRGEVGLLRRPPEGLLGGMLGLPTSAWRDTSWTSAEALAAAPAAGDWRPSVGVAHAFTHFSLELRVMCAAMRADNLIWRDSNAALGALPSVFRKVLRSALGAENVVNPPSLFPPDRP